MLEQKPPKIRVDGDVSILVRFLLILGGLRHSLPRDRKISHQSTTRFVQAKMCKSACGKKKKGTANIVVDIAYTIVFFPVPFVNHAHAITNRFSLFGDPFFYFFMNTKFRQSARTEEKKKWASKKQERKSNRHEKKFGWIAEPNTSRPIDCDTVAQHHQSAMATLCAPLLTQKIKEKLNNNLFAHMKCLSHYRKNNNPKK